MLGINVATRNLPKPLLDKQAQPFLVSAEIENVLYHDLWSFRSVNDYLTSIKI